MAEIQIRVRYAETDQMGYLHHANFLIYFEMARTELLRSNGLTYKDLEAEGNLLVVVRAQCRYYRPARYDDLLVIRTTVVRATGARIDHHYDMFRDGELLAEGETTLACVDREGKLQRMPQMLRTTDF